MAENDELNPPDPTAVYGHINLRDIGDSHLVQQSPVFAQARAAALDPDADPAELGTDEPNLAGFDLTANEPVTVLDGEAQAARAAEEQERDAELRRQTAADQVDNAGPGPSAAGVRTAEDKGQPDRKEQAQAQRDEKPSPVKAAAKKVADKVHGKD